MSAANFEQIVETSYTPEDTAQEYIDFLLATFQGWNA